MAVDLFTASSFNASAANALVFSVAKSVFNTPSAACALFTSTVIVVDKDEALPST